MMDGTKMSDLARLLNLYSDLIEVLREARTLPVSDIKRWKLSLKFNKLREKIHEETAGQVSVVELSQAYSQAQEVAASGEVGTHARSHKGC
jgi:hypothetical protein